MHAGESQAATVTFGWNQVQRVSVTTPTLQVVSNRLLKRGIPTHAPAFAELKALGATQVRYVPWFPFPELGTAEPKAPDTKTYWDFSQIDPMVMDVMDAQQGRPVVMNFSTIPDWVLTDTTYKLLGDYYARLLSWYTKGAFTDELGAVQRSGHAYQ